MTRCAPILISTVTAMPGESGTSLPSTAIALRALPVEDGELGALLAGLVEQQSALGRQQPRRRAVGRIKSGERIAVGERRMSGNSG
jgi:hypothetical protein